MAKKTKWQEWPGGENVKKGQKDELAKAPNLGKMAENPNWPNFPKLLRKPG